MSDRLKALMPLIQALNDEERVELREQLEEPELSEEEWEAAWGPEIERRVEEMRNGTVETVTWEEIKEKLKAFQT